MSHFTVLVLLDPAALLDIDGAVERALAPYDENADVSEYERPCFCIGDTAKMAAYEGVARQLGEWGAARAAFAERHAAATSDAKDAAWATEVVAPREALHAELLAAHPDREKPAADCEECSGTGVERTTSNPRGKWDWWVIGGRWTGALSDYDPVADDGNREVCWLCAGTGKRTDAIGSARRVADPTYGCNGCDGTGRMLMSPSKWKRRGVIATVPTVIAKGFTPFAVVTPDGSWSQRGEMGWFATVRNEKAPSQWGEEVAAIYAAHADRIAVLVDCHT